MEPLILALGWVGIYAPLALGAVGSIDWAALVPAALRWAPYWKSKAAMGGISAWRQCRLRRPFTVSL